MRHDDHEMSESEIRDLLHGNLRAIATSSDQRDRLRSLLPADVDVVSDPVVQGPDGGVDDDSIVVEFRPPAQVAGRVLRARWLGAAAAAILMVFVLLRPDDTKIEATDNGGTVTTIARDPGGELSVCPTDVATFAEAVAAWGSIEKWSHLTDSRIPEPDLVALVTSALSSVSELDSGSVAEAQQQLDALPSRASSDDAVQYLSAGDRLLYFEAVAGAASLIEDLLDNNGGSGCVVSLSGASD